ncbi:MAG TPA: hypothetical protein VE944_04820 [Nostoc sp.]|uniref:hypothetical protein n=1 Tax=Nostoc sp. TaxID=1180 RepID=UPI002D6DDB67|nr:hypothetical protein [Nostoc sp.]HYX13686.1 hypothetical protein [Nostoc sp.]
MDKKPKLSPEEQEKYIASLADDYEPDGKYGNDPEHLGLKPGRARKSGDLRTIRLDDEFLADIKAAAADEGFDSYQTFIKVILKRYIKDRKKA